jgi:Zn-finger nucleic acid-binding protein
MAQDRGRLRINKRAFLDDFLRGASDKELRQKYGLKHSQLRRVVGMLKQRGALTSEMVARRDENLRIRFGDKNGPPDPERDGRAPVDLDTGLVLHCPACGAPVKRGIENCGYCGAHLDFSLKGKTVHCPHCFRKIPAESSFCYRCARPVKSKVPQGKILEDRLCPRCRTAMIGRAIEDFSVMSCDSCEGMFIPHETFEMMQESSQRVIVPTERVQSSRMKGEERISYVRCPVCRKMMNRKNFARISGVIVDICGNHGIWFDAGEVEKVMDFISRGGLQKSRQREIERLKDEEKLMKLRKEQTLMQDQIATPMTWVSDSSGEQLDLIGLLGGLFRLFRS